jgi:SiaC family regulatory phosphoprotein
MNKFFIEETEFTPELSFDLNTRKFIFKGVSRPEDVFKFYEPAIDWLKELDQNLLTHSDTKYNITNIDVEFRLSYFNSASSKMILLILEALVKIQKKGVEITVDWYYDENDEQMYDDGMDLSGSVSLPFNFYKI